MSYWLTQEPAKRRKLSNTCSGDGCSVTNSMSKSLWPQGFQQTRLLCHSLTPRLCSNSGPVSWWCYLTISSSAFPFFFCFQSFPASGSFPRSQSFASWGQNIGASASTSVSVFPMNNEGWFPLGLTGLISLQSKGLSRVFSRTIIQKYQLFGTQISLWSKYHIHMTTG